MKNSENNIKHIIRDNGREEWYGSYARPHQNEDVPAMISSNGTEKYWEKGYSTRKYGPYVKYPDGYEQWNTKENLLLYRENGASVIWNNGIREYL